jgi:hypothetical protein
MILSDDYGVSWKVMEKSGDAQDHQHIMREICVTDDINLAMLIAASHNMSVSCGKKTAWVKYSISAPENQATDGQAQS